MYSDRNKGLESSLSFLPSIDQDNKFKKKTMFPEVSSLYNFDSNFSLRTSKVKIPLNEINYDLTKTRINFGEKLTSIER